MLKEQLHRSFDSISPSPELLDKVSAMMREEVSKKKPPIYMNAVKYGGIAAALAIAAGGTFLALNSSRGVETAPVTTAATAVAEAVQDIAEVPENAAEETASDNDTGDMVRNDVLAESGDTAAVTTTAPETAAEADEEPPAAVILDAVPDEDAPDSVMNVTDAETAAAETYAGETEAPENNADYIEPEMRADSGADDAPEAVALTADDVPEAEAEEEPADPMNEPAEDDDAGSDEADDEADMVILDDVDEADGDDAYVIVPIDEPDSDAADNPGTGPGDGDTLVTSAVSAAAYDHFCYPFEDVINSIPYFIGGLREHADWDKFSVRTEDIDGIESYANLYTFIKDYGITREEFDKAASGAGAYSVYGPIADVLYSGDIAAMTAEYATPSAIVKGSKAYSPYWLMSHSIKDYKEAGITADDILSVYDQCVNSPAITDEEKAAVRRKLGSFLEKNGIVPPADE